jgi:hypothetical protein
MNRIALWILAQFLLLFTAQGVPPVLNYAGQVAVNGEAFDGNGLFKFALVNADGTTTYWSNDGTSVDGSEPQASVSVSVNGGLYSILLGNTAQQGMGAIDPALFAQNSDAKLRVWFSDGVNGFQQLSPDRPFASVPYAFSAGTAQTAGFAPIANGAVNLDMLSEDLKTQINAPISRSRLTKEVVADINATIGLDRLSSEIISKLEQNATITNGSVTGIKMADGAITTDKLNEQILKYLKPEITSQPQAQTVYADSNDSFSVTAEGKYLTYQWKKDGVDLTGGTNATLNITDANATLHDGNYSVVVSNDFGSVESDLVELKTIQFPNTSNMLLWLDASDESTVIHNSKFVEMWVDKSGNNNNASQANSQNKPRTSISSISNLNSIDFDGNSDFMNISTFSGTLSAFLVLKVDVASGTRRILSQGAHIGATGDGFMFRIEDRKFRALGIPTSGNSIINNMVLLVSMDCSTKLYVNGEFIGSKNILDITAPEIMNISSYNNGKGEFFDGSIGEMIFLQTTFDAHIRQKYEGYLAHKWGLMSNLPADHPYKNNAP